MVKEENNLIALQDHRKQAAKLAEDRKRILALPGQDALHAIFEHPQPEALVRSFAEEDFFFLVHDIGPEDALEVLSMASASQWEYILDMELWEKDRIDINAMTRWMGFLMEADPNRFMDWAMTEKPEMFEYYLFKNIDVRLREHDQDPSDFGDNYLTFDDVFYIGLPNPPEDATADLAEFEKKHAVLLQFLRRLADMDHLLYQQTLLRAAAVIPAESEEEFFRLRNVRLAEKGFLPFDEAVGVYQPIRLEHLKKQKKIIPEIRDEDDRIPAPLNHAALLEKDHIFSRALSLISLEESFNQIQAEFAGLCNRIVSADQTPVRDREGLRKVVKKACGYIEIGMERLCGGKDKMDDSRIAAAVKAYPLTDLFRAGYAMTAELKQQALHWKKKSWFAANRLALSFWGERLVGVIGGLLVKRPLFFDNYRTGVLYREFETMADIRQTQADLTEAMAFDDLLSCFSLDTGAFPKGYFITHENLLLTLWARHRLGLKAGPAPIPLGRFKPFFEDLWETKGMPGRIKPSKKTDFLIWLSDQSGFSVEEISKTLGNALERLFGEIEAEYGNVFASNLDPRYVHLFLLKNPHQ